MSVFEIMKKCLTGINFKGRATRKEYIIFKIFQFVFGLLGLIFFVIPVMIVGYKTALASGSLPQGYNYPDININMQSLAIYCLISFLIFVPLSIWIGIANLCVSIKRLHDFNYSGWIYFAYIVILMSLTFIKDSHGISNSIGLLASFGEFIVLACIKGTDGANQFGVTENKVTAVEAAPAAPQEQENQ